MVVEQKDELDLLWMLEGETMNQQIVLTEKGITTKLEMSLDRIRQFEPQGGYYLAFSGGKDSIVCYHLLKMARVKFDAHYSNTTVDPPELVRFIKKEYPDVGWNNPDKTMWKLIEDRTMPPTRRFRYCCDVLKEGGGEGRFVVTGVRWAESIRRKNTRYAIEFDKYGSKSKLANEYRKVFLNSDNDKKRRLIETCQTKGKHILNPIIDWEDWEVWDFIKSNNILYPELYDKGFDRLGCIGCPLQGLKGMQRDFEKWPRYRAKYVKTFEKMIQARKSKGLKTSWETGEEVMDWWLQ